MRESNTSTTFAFDLSTETDQKRSSVSKQKTNIKNVGRHMFFFFKRFTSNYGKKAKPLWLVNQRIILA
jgi:hypothetical protein